MTYMRLISETSLVYCYCEMRFSWNCDFFTTKNRPGVFDMQFAAGNGNAIPQSVDSCLIIGFIPTKEEHYLVTKSDSEFDFLCLFDLFGLFPVAFLTWPNAKGKKCRNPPVARDEVKVIMEKYPNIRVFESRLSSKDKSVMMGWFVVYSIVFLDQRGKNFPQKKGRSWVVMFC